MATVLLYSPANSSEISSQKLEIFTDSTVLTLSICIMNFLMHTVGTIVLIRTDKGQHQTTQHVFLINLAAIDALLNFTRVVYLVLVLKGVRVHASHLRVTNINIASVFGATGLHYIHYLSMFYITIDRLLLITFPFNYNVFCTRGRAKKLLAFTWIINLLISFGVSFFIPYVGYESFNEVTYDVLFTYIPTVCNVLFFVFAVSVYSLMFHKFYQSSRISTKGRDGVESLWCTFRKSRFFISVLLIGCCLLLNVIPRLAYSFVLISKPDITYNVPFAFVSISVALADTADSVIYIFLQPFVRGYLSKKCLSLKSVQRLWEARRGRFAKKDAF